MTLKYKKRNSFQTSCGGLASIITFGIFLSWIVIEIIDVYIKGSFTKTETIQLTQSLSPGLVFPIYNISQP